jgi:hypothetical protein
MSISTYTILQFTLPCNATLTVLTKVTDTCWLLITFDEIYFILMYKLILLHKFKYSLMHGYGTLSQVLCQPFALFCIHHHAYIV